MAAKFVATSYDEDGNPVDGYWEDEPGSNYSNEGNNQDAGPNYSHEGRNAYGYDDPSGRGNITDQNQFDAETNRLRDMAKGDPTRGLGNISPGSDIPADDGSTWDKFATGLKLKNPDGSYDWSKILGLAGAGIGTIGALTNKPEGTKSIADLRAGMPSRGAQSFTPQTLAMMQRPMQTGSALQRVYAADMQQPIAKGQTYAEGGEVMPAEMQEAPGALSQVFSGAVQGSDGGQSDLVDAKLSAGEYVLDAETVSALGDGNTQAGIAKLDELRAKLREQKRSAPTQDIPPQAQGPLSYMQGA